MKHKFVYIVDGWSNKIASRYVGNGIVHKTYYMGAWGVEYSPKDYKLHLSTTERSVGYKFKKSRKVK